MISIFTKDFWIHYLNQFTSWITAELPSIIVIIILFFLALKFFNKLSAKLKTFLLNRRYIEKSNNPKEAEKRVNTLVNLMQGATKIILWIVFIIIMLSKIGIEVAPLLAGAGIVGLAVGFGAQELVRDIISGFFILLENQIRVGDIVLLNNTGGLVEKIELRTITLRDLSGTVHVFQNGKINSISNMTKEWSAILLEIGVAYKENVNDVIAIMQEVSKEMRESDEYKDVITEDLEVMGLDRFDSSAVVIKARLITKPGEQWSTGREYRKRLKYRFDAENIEIPFPHTTLYWGSKTPPLKIDDTKKE